MAKKPKSHRALAWMTPEEAYERGIFPHTADWDVLHFLAEAGYREAARERLAEYANALERGDYVRAERWTWLIHVLRAIAAGERANDVLKLKPRGHPPSLALLKRMHEAAWSVVRRPEGQPLMQSSEPDVPPGAITEAAEQFGISESDVKRALAIFGRGIPAFLAGKTGWEEPLPDLGALKASRRRRKAHK